MVSSDKVVGKDQMLPGDDVLDMKPADRLVLLAQTAILAPVAGPVPHPLA